jgi:hypothetical protein
MAAVTRWIRVSLLLQCLFGIERIRSLHLLFPLPVLLIVVASPPLLFAQAYRKRWQSPMWICVAYYSAALAGACTEWWRHSGQEAIPAALLLGILVVSATGLIKLERLDSRPVPLWIFR